MKKFVFIMLLCCVYHSFAASSVILRIDDNTYITSADVQREKEWYDIITCKAFQQSHSDIDDVNVITDRLLIRSLILRDRFKRLNVSDVKRRESGLVHKIAETCKVQDRDVKDAISKDVTNKHFERYTRELMLRDLIIKTRILPLIRVTRSDINEYRKKLIRSNMHARVTKILIPISSKNILQYVRSTKFEFQERNIVNNVIEIKFKHHAILDMSKFPDAMSAMLLNDDKASIIKYYGIEMHVMNSYIMPRSRSDIMVADFKENFHSMSDALDIHEKLPRISTCDQFDRILYKKNIKKNVVNDVLLMELDDNLRDGIDDAPILGRHYIARDKMKIFMICHLMNEPTITNEQIRMMIFDKRFPFYYHRYIDSLKAKKYLRAS